MIVPGGVHQSGTRAVIPVFLELIKRLADRHDLTVMALRQYREFRRYELCGARIIHLGFKKFFPESINFLRRWQRLKSWMRSNQGAYDLIHAFWLNQPGMLACMAASRFRLPLVASLGGGESVWLPEIGYGGAGSPAGRFQLRRVLKAADRVTAGSRYALETLRQGRPDVLRVPLFPCVDLFQGIANTAKGPPITPGRLAQSGEGSSHLPEGIENHR